MTPRLALVLVFACSSSPVDPGPDGHDQLTPPLDGMESQGRLLLGETLDAVGGDPTYHFATTTHGTTADGTAVEVSFSGTASLAADGHVGIDPYFVGLVLATADGGQLEITPARGGTDLAFYTLRYTADGGATWLDVCDGDAVPFAGRWRRTGLHEADTAYLSFACTGAVAWKCTEWGYLSGADPESTDWRAHQACTRMARADYCGDGTSHTREGTQITIYDRLGINLPTPQIFPPVAHWPPAPQAFYFEAAWNDGDRAASCLGRSRWQSIAIDGACADPTRLVDPRKTTSARFCDDIDFTTTTDVPLLYNTSHYNDLALDVWSNGNDRISTVRGYYDEIGTTPDRAPFPSQSYAYMQPDAMLLRVPATSSDLVEIHLYANGTDKTLAEAGNALLLGNGYTDLGWEGYAKSVGLGREVPFVLYRDPSTGDVIATTLVPPGYNALKTIGYLIPNPDLP